MTLRVDGRGPSTTYGYDAVDRLTELMYQNGNIATMTYDAISRRTVLADCLRPRWEDLRPDQP
jgi:YD repeat-containing protein